MLTIGTCWCRTSRAAAWQLYRNHGFWISPRLAEARMANWQYLFFEQLRLKEARSHGLCARQEVYTTNVRRGRGGQGSQPFWDGGWEGGLTTGRDAVDACAAPVPGPAFAPWRVLHANGQGQDRGWPAGHDDRHLRPAYARRAAAAAGPHVRRSSARTCGPDGARRSRPLPCRSRALVSRGRQGLRTVSAVRRHQDCERLQRRLRHGNYLGAQGREQANPSAHTAAGPMTHAAIGPGVGRGHRQASDDAEARQRGRGPVRQLQRPPYRGRHQGPQVGASQKPVCGAATLASSQSRVPAIAGPSVGC